MNQIAAPPGASSTAPVNDMPASLQSTSLLEASRRVDWRFLLPDPNLGVVAVAGMASRSLREALPLFCEQVSFVEAPYSAAQQVDVVVICGGLDAPLADALALVKPGGHVYVEMHGRAGRSLAAHQKLLQARGFEDI